MTTPEEIQANIQRARKQVEEMHRLYLDSLCNLIRMQATADYMFFEGDLGDKPLPMNGNKA